MYASMKLHTGQQNLTRDVAVNSAKHNPQLQSAWNVKSDHALQRIGTALQPTTPKNNVQLKITQWCILLCLTLLCDQSC